MKPTLTTIELFEEGMNFSVAHFTLFSKTERERLHGHNYRVHALLTTVVQDIGITFDYAIYREKLLALCQRLNRYLLLPEKSPLLKIVEKNNYYYVYFNEDEMPFLKKDVLMLPIRNITIEELASWFVEQLVADKEAITKHRIQAITIKVSNGPGRCGSASWG